MKLLLLCSALVFTTLGFAQSVKLGDMITYLSKSNASSIDQSLKSKGWQYYGEEDADTKGIKDKIWTFKYNTKTDKAVAWMIISFDKEQPLRALYEIFDYTLTMPFSNSIYEYSFGFEDIKQDEKEFKKRYANNKFYLYEYQQKNHEKGYHFDLVTKGTVLDGRNGTKTTYYDNGNVKTEYVVVDDKLNGYQKTYYENGNLKKEGLWKDDKETGVFKFYTEDGILDSDETYVNGKLEGPAHFYYEDGTLEYLANYSYGKKSGIAEKYNASGELISKTNYIGDKKFGQYTEYIKGEISFKCYYLDGELNGMFKETLYTEENEPYAKVSGMYVNGYLDGKIVGMYLNGKDTLSVRTYAKNAPAGSWRYYNENGKLKKTVDFVNGHGNTMSYYDNGKLTDHIVLTSSDADYWFFKYEFTDEDSKITVNYRVPIYELEKNYNEFNAFETQTGVFTYPSILSSNDKFGLYTYENNVLIFSGNYDAMNMKNGKWSRNFKKQKVSSEITYVDGELIDEKFFDKKGKPYSGKLIYTMVGTQFTIMVKDGLRNGYTEEKNLETKEVVKYNYANGVEVD